MRTSEAGPGRGESSRITDHVLSASKPAGLRVKLEKVVVCLDEPNGHLIKPREVNTVRRKGVEEILRQHTRQNEGGAIFSIR